MSIRRAAEARHVGMRLLQRAIDARKAGELGDAELQAINLGTAELLEQERVVPAAAPPVDNG